MNREELRQSLRKPYQRDNWTRLVRSVFGNHVRLNAEAQPLPTDDDSIKSIAQIGDVLLDDGKNLAVIEVEVADSIHLLRNRVSLRNRVAKFIDQDRAHGVLAVFCSGRPEYRFSFTARETVFDEEAGIIEKETATKRFTYVLGPGETCNTAAERFERLSHKSEQIAIDDVVEAFSVEKLNKEFFNTYRDHYERFCSHLLADGQRVATYRLFKIEKITNAAEQSRREKPVRDFVKRLLGRIVFLHFLQKKGWMGCPAGQKQWTGGDPEFLRSYFENTSEKNRFHSRWLLPLFYEALNRPDRPDDIFGPTGTRIPYLNGGLFEPMIDGESDIDFPSEYFDALLEFFGRYNFTIDENDPDEHEVGIDPEMLGHIFENLLEDNKDKGAYYTPKAIVHYMCQQSLIYYLLRHLGESDQSRDAVRYLVRNKQVGEGTGHLNFIKTHAAEIERLLDAVRICDPAIGSGAFPIGLLQEIFWLKLTLDLTLNQPAQLADIKRDIIQNSIYGVDKDAGAVDIARLRFWLALVVDETEPRPLPNLDYKIMQGDSLLESFEGVPLGNLMDPGGISGITISPTAQAEMDFASDQMVLSAREKSARITGLMSDYYAAESPAEKQRIHREIDAFVLQHIDYNLSIAKEEFATELHQHHAEIERKRLQMANYAPPKKAARRMEWLEKSIAELGEKKLWLEKLEHEAERPYFLWQLFFQDVFANGGFDIVIANPPYVRQEVIKDYKPLLEAEGYECFKGTADLFVYFYERSVKMLREGGVLTFITSNKYYRSGYGESLRGFLAKELRLREMLDFGDAPVFDAIAYASILIGGKDSVPNAHRLRAWNWKRGEKIGQVARIMGEKAFTLEQQNLTPDGWRLERPEVFALLRKLKSKGTPLGEYVNGRFYRGILTGLNEAFVIDRATKDRLIAEDPKSEEILKPFLRGRDVKRWRANWAGYYLIKIESSQNKKHPWSGMEQKEAEEVFKQTYPAVHAWLQQFRDGLIKRQDQGKYFWELRACVYWQEFLAPKIFYPDIYEHQSFAYDLEGFYTANTAYFIPVSEKWLTSVLNSDTTEWVYRNQSNVVRGGYLRAFTETMQFLPVPIVKNNDEVRLSRLTKRASESEGESLAAIESEINQIVYRLFDLTPEEIRLIESTIGGESEPIIAGEHGKTTRKDAFFRCLRELAGAHPYVSFERIKQSARTDKRMLSDDTLYDYLGEAVETGIIHHAGRGWYTRNEKPATLDGATVGELKDALKNRFPLLPHYLWSPLQFNPWLHHQLGQAPSFVYAETEGLEDMAEFLRNEGWEVSVSPGKNDPRPGRGPRSVVLRGFRREIGVHEPAVETVLVDLFIENKRLELMDAAELSDMAHKLLAEHRVDLAHILRLLGDRKQEITGFVSDKSTQYLGIF